MDLDGGPGVRDHTHRDAACPKLLQDSERVGVWLVVDLVDVGIGERSDERLGGVAAQLAERDAIVGRELLDLLLESRQPMIRSEPVQAVLQRYLQVSIVCYPDRVCFAQIEEARSGKPAAAQRARQCVTQIE